MRDVLVLCYHAVSERWPSELAVSPDLLDEQITALERRGYRAATFTRAVTDPPWRRTLAITFDDAYRSTLDLAAPVLARHGAPGTVYAPTDWVGREEPMSWPGIEEWADGPHRDELLCLTWDGLGELAEQGWEVGSHTRSHPRLPQVVDDADARARAGRLARAAHGAARAAATRSPTRTATTTSGWSARRAPRATAPPAPSPGCRTRPRPLSWPRVGVYPGNRPLFLRLKTSRARCGRWRWPPGVCGASARTESPLSGTQSPRVSSSARSRTGPPRAGGSSSRSPRRGRSGSGRRPRAGCRCRLA